MRVFGGMLAAVVPVALALTGLPAPVGAQEQAGPGSETLQGLLTEQESDQAAADAEEELLEPAELDELVAPVALYPDALLAQVLVAATYPLEIVRADRLIAESGDMTEEEFRAAIDAQEWDPSVLVLLAGFPTLIERMAEDLDWTERLGNAMLRQDEDVLAAVQRMRTAAQATGNLETNAAQVVEEDEGEIYIRPADPEVVYVPQYDSTAAFAPARNAAPYYTQPPSGFSAQNALVTGAVAFGAALLIDELFGEDDNDNDGWDDYWRRPRAIDWRQGEFYPRPYWRSDRSDRDNAWSRERDRHWNRAERRWRRDRDEDRQWYARAQHDAVDWAMLPGGRDKWSRAYRRERDFERELRAMEREKRARVERRQERRERAAAIERRETRQDTVQRRNELLEKRERVERRQERRERAAAIERRETRQQAAERRSEALEKRERAERRRERRENAAAERPDARGQAAATERRELLEERERAERRRERRENAAAERPDARGQAGAAERRELLEERERAERRRERRENAAAVERRRDQDQAPAAKRREDVEKRARVERRQDRREQATANERRRGGEQATAAERRRDDPARAEARRATAKARGENTAAGEQKAARQKQRAQRSARQEKKAARKCRNGQDKNCKDAR